jgi:hypothetical protein
MLLSKIMKQGIHANVPRIDLSNFLSQNGDWQEDCRVAA